MSIYAIGDIHGCFDDLLRLLDVIKFNEQTDQLWFAGDLVNRGLKSLDTLRFVKSLGQSAHTVLGNHDLHLLATAFKQQKLHKKDTLYQVLTAPDRDELLHWLRMQPLLINEADFCLLHAGVPPQWDLVQIKAMATLAEQELQSDHYLDFFNKMYGNKPDQWSTELKEWDKIRFIINCFTRLRYCTVDGQLDFTQTGAIGSQPADLIPWFTVPNRKSSAIKIIFGHWSSLGYHHENNVYGIDTGCLWGGELTAIKLGTKIEKFSVQSTVKHSKHS